MIFHKHFCLQLASLNVFCLIQKMVSILHSDQLQFRFTNVVAHVLVKLNQKPIIDRTTEMYVSNILKKQETF